MSDHKRSSYLGTPQAKQYQQSLAVLKAENERLRRDNQKLRDALGPFACLGRNELTTGDFNRARRVLAATGTRDE